MSQSAILDVSPSRYHSSMTKGGYGPSRFSCISETAQELLSALEEFLEETPMASGRHADTVHYQRTFQTNTPPPSMVVSTRSEISYEPPPVHISQDVSLYYEQRIFSLELAGIEDGIELNQKSERDFWDFINIPSISRQAELVFIGKGNLRAIWEDEIGNFIGLHFPGNRRVIYVMFKQLPDQNTQMTDTDMVSFEKTVAKIGQHGLEFLVNS